MRMNLQIALKKELHGCDGVAKPFLPKKIKPPGPRVDRFQGWQQAHLGALGTFTR